MPTLIYETLRRLLEPIVTLAARYRMPAVYPLSDYAAAGGLISYGANRSDSFRRAGFYVGRVLNGTQPSAGGKIRARNQPQDCESARHCGAAYTAYAR